MLWVKAFHIIAMVCWFAGLFYLPRLFVYHAACEDQAGRERFKVMERKLYRGITTPSMVITIALGIWLVSFAPAVYASQGWFHAKLLLVVILVGYHVYCGRLVKIFRDDANRHSHVFYRWFNEFPVLILVSVVILVVVKPF
ncbi:MAG: TIGR00701 family protein [Alteromonadaceae bacterium]|uniref:protoporphyrinogen oxidase HemJ n=1 Tax=unclassified Marinobacter TaxID=83889 RepID=UPI000C52A7B6|nr:protoporphyrinogen oxidase HemJ [Marinobacter sp. BGYM27]MAA66367.1 TIGR00701 family protein [Alteromonadaceae bacterium]MBH85225.1 TIGR00701 family protein [Alteromonadaceae bacterium]MDG5499770.1 protoporphyrinogen oxidase HemJ [Marinobacter sp. BGYM27]|tara:strand:+ start:332 stop:754 length:423 start_codon:yes stop_codon:yes gene_type:complete